MQVKAGEQYWRQRSFGRQQWGFTLIEFVIVIAVLGALAAIALPELSNILRNVSKADVQTQARTLQTRNEINAIACSTNGLKCTSIRESGENACVKGIQAFLSNEFWENEFTNGDYEVINIPSSVDNDKDREVKRLEMIENKKISEASAIFYVTRDRDYLEKTKSSSWFDKWNVEQPCILYAK